MSNQPNILFVFPDQLRHNWVGPDTDVPVRTPTVNSLIENGVGFRNAITPAPVCGPARACLASGMEYDRCGVRGHRADYPLSVESLYDRLRDEAGYHVIGTGKFDLQKRSHQVSPGMGPDGTRYLTANGFSEGVNCLGKWDAVSSWDGDPLDPYTAYLAEEDLIEDHVTDFYRRRETTQATFPTPLPSRAYCDNWIGRRTIDFLEAAPEDQPWFLQVNFAGPHSPWDVTEAMHEWYREPPIEFPEPVDPSDELPSETHQEVRRNYAAMTENIDQWVDRFLECVRERNELDQTIIVFASDHGELLGDHGHWSKKLPYHGSVGVPFVVSGPGINERGMVDEPATILDFHATVLEWAGLSYDSVDSRSLASYLAGDGDYPRETVFAGLEHWRLAFDGHHKLIRGFDPDQTDTDAWNETRIQQAIETETPLLFALDSGTAELNNVYDDRTSVADRLDGKLRFQRGVVKQG